MTSDTFRSMPPRRHDRTPERSGVLAHICETLGCDLNQAIKTFHYLRNKRHLVFDSRRRIWRGVEFVPIETDDQRTARLQAEIDDLRSRYMDLANLVSKLRSAHNQLAIDVANAKPAQDDDRMTNG